MTVPCSYCLKEVDRADANKKATCFDCKLLRRQAYSIKYRAGLIIPKKRVIDPLKRQRLIAEREEKKKEAAQRRTEREFAILFMYDEGLTLQQIGERFVVPLSRERIRQILCRIERREGITILRHTAGRPTSPLVKTVCSTCQTEIVIKERRLQAHKRHYCSRKCQREGMRKYFNTDGTPMTKGEKDKWAYHNNPKRRDAQNKATMAYYNRKKTDPVFIARNNAYQKEYHRKKRARKLELAREKALSTSVQ